MSETDDESLILELLHRLDSKLDALGARLDRFDASFDAAEGGLTASFDSLRTMLERQLVASEKSVSDEIEDLRRTVEEYHAELSRNLGERLRRKIERAGSPPAESN